MTKEEARELSDLIERRISCELAHQASQARLKEASYKVINFIERVSNQKQVSA